MSSLKEINTVNLGKGFMKGLSEEGIFEMKNGNVSAMYKGREKAIVSAKGLRQKRKWLVSGTEKKAELWKQGGQGKNCDMKLEAGPINRDLWALAWSLKFIVSIKGSRGY